jgi:hypothetical protein
MRVKYQFIVIGFFDCWENVDLKDNQNVAWISGEKTIGIINLRFENVIDGLLVSKTAAVVGFAVF